jgi:transposase
MYAGGMKPLEITHRDVTKERLIALADEMPGAWAGLKIAALLLAVEGQRPGWITSVLGLTRMSMTRWIHAVNRGGVAALKPKIKPGRPTKLTPRIVRALAQQLEQSPQEFGLYRGQWDGPTVATHVKRRFGVILTVRQAQRWMHQLGYRLKRAGYSYLQAKASEAKAFQRRLKKTPASGPA